MKSNDVPWRSGKVFGYTYEAAKEIEEVVYKAYLMFLGENALDPTVFPSLRQLETEVVTMAAELLGGNEETTGNFTSGGTESIMLAVKTARDYFRDVKPEITKPEIIVARTAHAAFHKAGHYLDVNVVVVPVNKETFMADVAATEAAITENTIMIVGSSPSYPHGVIDPIEDLAKMAKDRGILCHVDACVGGMYLPFAKKLGYDIPAFDFSVDGVTSMSCDFHKYGYAAKGASCVLHKDANLRRYQIFTCASWAGYSIVNPTVLSSKTGGPMAGAWAVLKAMGQDGYMEIVDAGQKATQHVIEGIEKIPGLYVMGKPAMNLVAIASSDPAINIFELSDAMKAKGEWGLQVQLACDDAVEALHLSINRANVPHIDDMLRDLVICIAELKNKPEEEEAFAIAPEVIEGMFANFSPEMFDSLEEMLGMGGDNPIPDKFAFINNILNSLPAKYRKVLLTEFVNRLFTV
ncbi:MAG: aspartate aminotransferase family protein [Aureispira sp.]|nr:aspartate aminotransferase family protein [Aureispira sp.]